MTARKLVVPVLALALACGALAGVPARAQALKIGVFDAQRISEETAEGAKIKARLRKIQEDKQAELKKMQEELQKLQQEFVATAASLSEEKRKQLGIKIQRKQIELEAAQKSANQELQMEVEQAQAEWQQRVLRAVQEYGKANGYTLILPVEVIGYAAPTVDITDELIRAIDNPGGSAPQAAGGQ